MDLGQEFDSPHLHQLEKIDKSSAFAGLLVCLIHNYHVFWRLLNIYFFQNKYLFHIEEIKNTNHSKHYLLNNLQINIVKKKAWLPYRITLLSNFHYTQFVDMRPWLPYRITLLSNDGWLIYILGNPWLPYRITLLSNRRPRHMREEYPWLPYRITLLSNSCLTF